MLWSGMMDHHIKPGTKIWIWIRKTFHPVIDWLMLKIGETLNGKAKKICQIQRWKEWLKTIPEEILHLIIWRIGEVCYFIFITSYCSPERNRHLLSICLPLFWWHHLRFFCKQNVMDQLTYNFTNIKDKIVQKAIGSHLRNVCLYTRLTEYND